jgi:dienelactone hydrolase
MALRARALLLIALLPSAACHRTGASAPLVAPVAWSGLYRFDDGALVTIAPGWSTEWLRYRVHQTGESRRLYPVPDDSSRLLGGREFDDRGRGELEVVAQQGTREPSALEFRWHADSPPTLRTGRATRLAVHVEQIDFAPARASELARLRGRLLLPEGAGPFPALVIAHGSGCDAASVRYAEPWFYVANRVAVLVFDKRGCGSSTGPELARTMAFDVLAGDLAAAVRLLARHPSVDSTRIGIAGFSQGASYVGPLAAARLADAGAPPAFVISAYGMAESPLREEVEQTVALVRDAGFADDRSLADAESLATAAVRVVASGFRSGWRELDDVAARTRDARWRATPALRGRLTGDLLRWPHWIVRRMGPRAARRSTPDLDWTFDPMRPIDRLARARVPQLWVVARDDREAPSARTIVVLDSMRTAGAPITLCVLADADHGGVRLAPRSGAGAGPRRAIGYAPEEYAAQRIWLERVLRDPSAPVGDDAWPCARR